MPKKQWLQFQTIDRSCFQSKMIFHFCVRHPTASVVWWSEFLAANPESRVRFPALPDFLSSSGSGTGSTQPS
jgi:hypothetical protein